MGALSHRFLLLFPNTVVRWSAERKGVLSQENVVEVLAFEENYYYSVIFSLIQSLPTMVRRSLMGIYQFLSCRL